MNARRACATTAGLLLGMTIAAAALAQKQGGILRVQHRDSPASMSILEEGTISAIMPMMGVFNNLVLFDQHVPQNRAESLIYNDCQPLHCDPCLRYRQVRHPSPARGRAS